MANDPNGILPTVKPIRIVFLGTTEFGRKCLEALLEIPECRVAGAIAAPQKFPISYNREGVVNVRHTDIPGICRERNVPCSVLSTKMGDPTLFEQVRVWEPDIFLVAGWYHMVPARWREFAPAYGLHASLLPTYRGGAPLVWAMINGEQRTGISLFRLGDGVDDGPILGQAETEILPDDTIATLYSRIEDLGVGLLRAHIPRLADGSAVLMDQDHSLATTFPQRSPADGLIDWNWSARRIYDFIRAQTAPYPGAFAQIAGRKLTIWSSRIVDDGFPTLEPGKFQSEGQDLFVGTGRGALQLLDISINGEPIEPREALDWIVRHD